MLTTLGFSSLDQFVERVIPQPIRVSPLDNHSLTPLSESQLTQRALQLAAKNVPAKNFIGMGYSNALMPAPIATNVSLIFPEKKKKKQQQQQQQP
jgi:glycine dehydrogenase